MEIWLPCARCGSDNPGDSIFCIECGEKLSGVKKSAKQNQRKCKNCGQFNDLDALFCVACGEKINRKRKRDIRKNSTNPSFQTIFIFVALFLISIFLIKQLITVSKKENPSRLSSSSFSYGVSKNGVDEADVFAVAKNFICACGGCGEQPLETCTCDMPNGSVEEKNFIRKNLAQGLNVTQVIELVDEKYGHRK
jgi:hypothetical protein